MGLFSDDLDYKDLDAICIKLKRTIKGTTIELPLYVDVRISYVTWNNAKEVVIGGSTVKDLKKSGHLLSAIKPIFEKYVNDQVNMHPEYAEEIFPDDFFGEPQLEFSAKRAKELINTGLFKEALTKIDNPNGFEEVKFETVYAIAPVGFKIRNVSSGLSMPYDYSALVQGNIDTESEEVPVKETNIGIDENSPTNEPVSENIPDVEEEKDSEIEEIRRLQEEVATLEAKYTEKQAENQSAKESLQKIMRSVASLEEQLSKDKALVAEFGLFQEKVNNYPREIGTCKKRIHELELEQKVKQAQLDSLKTQRVDVDSNLLYSIIKHTSGKLL